MTHIVWDWNGTLFNDTTAVVDATNIVFAPYELGPLTLTDFQSAYTRPIWVMYERLLGRPLDDGEFDRLDSNFHDSYHQLMERCELAADARTTLAALSGAGHSQSLLSMWQHERLVPAAHQFGIAPSFHRIDGLRSGAPGGPKATFLVRHLEALGADAADVVLIGDSADDGLAARHVGARAVLYAGGMQSRADLEAVGFPVVEQLADLGAHL